MSLINDSLKEARRENGPSTGGQKMAVLPPRQPNSGNKGVILALVIMGAVFTVFIGGVVFLFLFLFIAMKPTEISSPSQQTVAMDKARLEEMAAQVKPLLTQPIPTPMPDNPPVVSQNPPPAISNKTPEIVIIPSPAPTAPVSPKPVTEPPDVAIAGPPEVTPPVIPAPPAVPAPPAIIAATADIRKAFVLKGIMKGRRGNMALINSRIVRENDNLKDGAVVVKVSETDVIISIGGQKYRLN